MLLRRCRRESTASKNPNDLILVQFFCKRRTFSARETLTVGLQLPYYVFIIALAKRFILNDLSASGGARTHNLWLRRPTLYPVELRMRQVWTIGSVRNAVNKRTRLRLFAVADWT